MRRSNMRLTPLILAACLLATAFTHLPVTAEAASEPKPDEEIAEEAVLEAEAAELDPDAPDVVEEEEPAPIDEKDVLVLTQSNFDDSIKKHKYILVEFYAPWCGHCQALAPEYAKAATALKAQGSEVALAKVDATVEAELGRKFAVEGYPTLKWFVDGEPLAYNGGRTEPDILKWIKKKTGPPASTLASAAELDKLKSAGKTFVVGYFSKLESNAHKKFEEAARAIDEVEFYQTTDSDIAKGVNLSKEGIALARTFEDELNFIEHTGETDKDAIKDFIKTEKVPPYIEFTEDNQEIIFGSGIPLNVIIVGSRAQISKGSPLTKAVKAAYEKVKGKVIFVMCDKAGDSSEPIVEFFGLSKDKKNPQAVAFNLESSHKYFLKEEDLSEKTLAAFAEGVISGAIKPDYKSDEVPTGDDAKDGEVAVVVGKNFDEVVLDQKKDVLLEAYAPWCGHCKSLAPTYKKLAKRFKDVDSVVIAKIDATANEHELLKVEGFPTILLFPSGKDQTPITYDGADRSLKSLTKFVKENAKKAFELPKKVKEEEEAEDKADAEEAAKSDDMDGGLPEGMDIEEVDGEPIDLDADITDLEDLSEEDLAEAQALRENDDAAEAAAAADADAHDEL